MRASTVCLSRTELVLPIMLPLAEKLAPSVDEGQTVRNKLREHIRIEHYNYADDGRQRHGMPEHEPENEALVADLVRRCRRDTDRLRVDHLAHHAARAVRCAHKNGAQVQLFRGDALQSAEQCVRGRITARERHAKPSDVSSEKGKEPSGAG